MLLKKLVENFHCLIIFILDQIFLLSPVSPKKKKTLLIIRLDGIGDFILWLDSVRHFINLFPDHAITLLGNLYWIELAKQLPYWDRIWSLDRRRFQRNLLYRFNILRKVRKAGFEIVIQPSHSREFLYGDSIVRVSCAQRRIGSLGDFSNIKFWQKHISDPWYTELVQTGSKPMMELQRNAEFLRGISNKNFEASCPTLNSIISDKRSEAEYAYYILFPSASTSWKQWPLMFFAKLADRIYLNSGWKGIICGGPGEEALGEKLMHLTNAPLENCIGKTSLTGLTKLIRKSKIIISNDTGAIHIAAAVETPSVCLTGGGHYGRFLPYNVEKGSNSQLPIVVTCRMDCFGCNWKCKYKIKKGEAVPCIRNISVDDVWTVTKPILSIGKTEKVHNNVDD